MCVCFFVPYVLSAEAYLTRQLLTTTFADITDPLSNIATLFSRFYNRRIQACAI